MTKTLAVFIRDNEGIQHRAGEQVNVIGEPRKRISGIDDRNVVMVQFLNSGARTLLFLEELEDA